MLISNSPNSSRLSPPSILTNRRSWIPRRRQINIVKMMVLSVRDPRLWFFVTRISRVRSRISFRSYPSVRIIFRKNTLLVPMCDMIVIYCKQPNILVASVFVIGKKWRAWLSTTSFQNSKGHSCILWCWKCMSSLDINIMIQSDLQAEIFCITCFCDSGHVENN